MKETPGNQRPCDLPSQLKWPVFNSNVKLGGGFKKHAHQYIWENEPIWQIFYKWVETLVEGEGSVWIHQSDYIQDVLTRHDDPPERTTPQPHLVKQAQGLAGELLWLVVRCHPDLSYPVNLMSQCMLKNPQLALKIGAQILGYLKSAKHWGIKYLLTRTLDTLEVQTDSGFAQSHLDMRSQQCVILLWGGPLFIGVQHDNLSFAVAPLKANW